MHHSAMTELVRVKFVAVLESAWYQTILSVLLSSFVDINRSVL